MLEFLFCFGFLFIKFYFLGGVRYSKKNKRGKKFVHISFSSCEISVWDELTHSYVLVFLFFLISLIEVNRATEWASRVSTRRKLSEEQEGKGKFVYFISIKCCVGFK